MAAFFRTLIKEMDVAVDEMFAEPVELHPWLNSDGRYSTSGMADSSRSVLKTMAIYVTPGAAATGERALVGGGISHTLEQDVWISIQQELLGDLSAWQAGDRVYWPERGEYYELLYPPIPHATLRPNVHLTRLEGTERNV